ncbi:hypothetical protein BV898_03834 [Hypsibius exemplaris]|uniref:Uncharacterized protein n=1 Tax=Hypsibius exemplaris TaxID=2072580 RepID=A0A1W0X4C0_HYPEX|nr:hypothetical protein BV898_03834 [Hypsibius exemplaris]
MDQRAWLSRSDPTFPAQDELNFEESAENQLVDLSESPQQRNEKDGKSSSSPSFPNGNSHGHFNKNGGLLSLSSLNLPATPPRGLQGRPLSQSSRLDRLSSYGSSSGPRFHSATSSPTGGSHGMFSTNEIHENLNAKTKEIYNLKVKVVNLEEQLERARECSDSSMLDPDLVAMNHRLQDEMASLRADMQREHEKHARELMDAFNRGYQDAEAAAAQASAFLRSSTQSSATGTSHLDGILTRSPQAAENKSGKWKPDSALKATSEVAVAAQLEEARRQGYAAALEELEQIKERPVLLEQGVNTSLLAVESNFDVTEYRDFPASGARLGAASAMSPFKRTRLAAGSDAGTLGGRRSSILPPMLSSTPQRMTGLERKTFAMLIQRLTELMEFLEAGLNGGSFNVSDTTLNDISQSFNRTGLDISLIADVGSGDGSHVSFSLADKLKELIDISRELSMHDAEVETDHDWEALQEEKNELMERVDALNKALAAASSVALTAEEEKARLEGKLTEVVSEVESLKEKLQTTHQEKEAVQTELAGLIENISGLEQQMADHQENQRFIMENTARRPDCHASTATDVVMDELDADLAVAKDENANLTQQVELLHSQLGNLESTKAHLESRLDELGALLTQWEAVDVERQALEDRLESLLEENGRLAANGEAAKELLSERSAQLESIYQQRSALEAELVALKTVRETEMEAADERAMRLETEITDVMISRQAIQDSLTVANEDIRVLKDNLQEVEQALRSQCELSQRLESTLNKDSRVVSLQTDVAWLDWKTEKVAMGNTISRMTDQLEILEADLVAVRASNERQIRAKEDERDQLMLLIDRFTREAEHLEEANRKLGERVNSLTADLTDAEAKLALSDEKRAKWEKAVRKQMDRTTKVVKQAEHNISAFNTNGGFTRGAAGPRPLNPLTENHDPVAAAGTKGSTLARPSS